ncbi:MAG: DUF1080 domain-containing protein [Sediminibacterium sp.]|nr:DUF1080 domain-containing protein [Sediminibacterium sp.]
MRKPVLCGVFIFICAFGFGQKKINIDSLVKEASKTEEWNPVPEKITPGTNCGGAPQDAIILFDGKNLDNFESKDHSNAKWKLNSDGSMTVVKGSGDIQTKQPFGSAQIHIEWMTPKEIAGSGQTRANSGIYLMSNYELQVLDSYNNPTYSNGQAGSIYKQHIPLVNACQPPGEWQSYDIVFMRPVFSAKGYVLRPATITVFQNGILILNNVTIHGHTEWIGAPKYTQHADKLPLLLQEHGLDGGNPLSFRNIWIRNLEP